MARTDDCGAGLRYHTTMNGSGTAGRGPKGGESASSAWSPFRHSVFTVLWTATVVSNVGTWMYNAGSGWLMTEFESRSVGRVARSGGDQPADVPVRDTGGRAGGHRRQATAPDRRRRRDHPVRDHHRRARLARPRHAGRLAGVHLPPRRLCRAERARLAIGGAAARAAARPRARGRGQQRRDQYQPRSSARRSAASSSAALESPRRSGSTR